MLRGRHPRTSFRRGLRTGNGQRPLEAVAARRGKRLCGNACLSAADVAQALSAAAAPETWIAEFLAEARAQSYCHESDSVEETFLFSRMVHSLGTALPLWSNDAAVPVGVLLPRLSEALRRVDAAGAPGDPAPGDNTASSACRVPAGHGGSGLEPDPQASLAQWAAHLHALGFEHLRSRIVASGPQLSEPPINRLRGDELVWGQAPARVDFAGGWTDTPPFSLEQGGQVLNAAVQLKGQMPVQVFARAIPELLICCRSIDRATRLEIRSWEQLLDPGETHDEFALARGALALSGFAPVPEASWAAASLAETLKRFGGGLELTALAAIPKGSGLGTSSIMGAVYLATIFRVLGRQLSRNELFNAVLRLEQIMTTGGGWQDQVGGVIEGLKRISTPPGLIPATTIVPLCGDLVDPRRNGGQTMLYYTGITRLAKNILQQVVGRWLDRERETVATLHHIHRLVDDMNAAIADGDLSEFGRLIATAWQLNNRLDPNSTTPEIDLLLGRIERHLHGAKLLGAGGGGFLFLVCKSSADAERVRHILETDPPNPRARFFDYDVSPRGLTVTVC